MTTILIIIAGTLLGLFGQMSGFNDWASRNKSTVFIVILFIAITKWGHLIV